MVTRDRRAAHTQRARVAYHEAGHVVLADWLGFPVRGVSIIPKATMLGHARIPRPRWWTRASAWTLTPYRETMIQRRAMMAMAGAAAEGIHRGRHTWHGTGGDLAVIDEALELLTGGRAEETTALYKWLWIRTQTLLADPTLWPRVEAVAAALLAHGALEGDQLHAALAAGDAARRHAHVTPAE